MKRLLIKPVDERAITYYESHSTYHPGDSGIDLFVLEDVSIYPGETKLIDLGIQCEMINLIPANNLNCSYYLYARSSIATKTPLILANSTGIIDAGYRGNIMAAVKYVPTKEDFNNLVFQTVNYLLENTPIESDNVSMDKIKENIGNQLPKYTIKAGTRLVQICAPDLGPLDIKLVKNLSQSLRGSGGFGSTNIKSSNIKQ
jgi:dUTP pyrophosphatase